MLRPVGIHGLTSSPMIPHRSVSLQTNRDDWSLDQMWVNLLVAIMSIMCANRAAQEITSRVSSN